MRLTLRVKLLLVSLLLLIIPLLGLRLNNSLKDSLLKSQEDALSLAALAVSTTLNNRADVFARERFHALQQDRDLYLFQLGNSVKIDDNSIDDWQPEFSSHADLYAQEHIIFSEPEYTPDSLSFRFLASIQGEYLYALFEVTDDYLVYQGEDILNFDGSDHLQIVIEKNGVQHKYILAPQGPGLVIGFLKPHGFSVDPPAEKRIHGVWNESAEGYSVELRIHTEMLGDKLAFAVADVDDKDNSEIQTLIGTANFQKNAELGRLLTTSAAIEEILEPLDWPHARVRVIDHNQRIRAMVGGFGEFDDQTPKSATIKEKLKAGLHNLLQPFYRFFTTTFTADIENSIHQPTYINLDGIKEGLEGKRSIARYHIKDGLVEVLAAIAPVYEKDKVIAVIAVEQTTNSILSLSNRLIEETVSLSIVAFLLGGGALFVFALVISSRIRTLRNQADASITEDGRIENAITKTEARDEIGDLGRTLDAMLTQLQEQINYREKMADNLEHEMRTPLAGVAASLKNIEEELAENQTQILEYLDGAKHNTQRLHELLTAIREAVTLKDSLSQENMEVINFGEAISRWLDLVWRKAFPEVEFSYEPPEQSARIKGDADRLLQALDKLIENAVSYHQIRTPIGLMLARDGEFIFLQVINKESSIDPTIHHHIFEYMVSSRVSKEERPHLGLGLYISKTIIEHHGGRLTGNNLSDGREGVAFTMTIPGVG